MTNPAPAPEPMGGAPDAYLPMDSDGTIYWQCAGPTEHDARMAMGRVRGYDGFEVVCLPLYRRIVPSTPTAPPSAACIKEDLCASHWDGVLTISIDELEERIEALSRPAPPATGGRESRAAQAAEIAACAHEWRRIAGNGVYQWACDKCCVVSKVGPASPATGGRDAQWLLTEAKSGLENWGRHHDWCQYGATAPCNCGLQGLLDKLTAPAPAPAERANGDELAEKYHAAWQAGYSAGVEWASRQSSAPAVELTEEAREAENDSWLAPFAPALRRKLEDDAIRRRVAEVTDADGWVRGLGDAPVSANQLLNRLTALSTPPSAGRES